LTDGCIPNNYCILCNFSQKIFCPMQQLSFTRGLDGCQQLFF
jgi:hypothetical protein